MVKVYDIFFPLSNFNVEIRLSQHDFNVEIWLTKRDFNIKTTLKSSCNKEIFKIKSTLK